jgi:glycine reductase complex component B subunit gamma
MTPVAVQVGAPRIVRVGRIPHPLGDPSRTPGRERQLRRAIVQTALEALCTAVDRPTVFEVPGSAGD